jgi:hypothetical protein
MKDSLADGDSCATLNCFNGQVTDCSAHGETKKSSEIYDSVSCGISPSDEDQYFLNKGMGTSNGGKCICPSGTAYFVGMDPGSNSAANMCTYDIPDHRTSYDFPGPWSFKSLECAPNNNQISS